MKFKLFPVAALLIAAAACNQSQPANEQNISVPNPPSAPNPPAPVPPEENGAAAQTPPSLPEPKGPIDPKSAEAAGQVVQHYGALIEQGRWTESWELWSNSDAARQFDRNWVNDSEVHMEIGKPADMEGAAGSSYISVPVTFYGKNNAGDPFRRPATVTLRRVNDVPGSTEAQRRWHVERIEFRNAS